MQIPSIGHTTTGNVELRRDALEHACLVTSSEVRRVLAVLYSTVCMISYAASTDGGYHGATRIPQTPDPKQGSAPTALERNAAPADTVSCPELS